MKTKYILSILLALGSVTNLLATSYSWLGSTSTNWATSSNWNPAGIPDSADNVTVSSGTYNLVLDQNRKVTNLTLSTKIIDLNGFSLTVYGVATMTSGTVTNGDFVAVGSLASFNGTLMDCIVDANCGYIRLSGSTFNEVADFTDQGLATGNGTGGCTFNDDVTITHNGTLTYFNLGGTSGDVFNGNVTFTNNSNRELNIAVNSSTNFMGNVILNSTSTGGILIGSSSGSATLASGKTISFGGSGFVADYLTLRNFTQTGSTAQTLTLTSTAIVNMISCTFNGNLTVSSPGFLLKNSTFNGTSSFTRTATSGNYQSDGGNTFNGSVTVDNSGTSGRIRWATTTPDVFNGNATFNSSGGWDVQIAYSGDNLFAGNITINSNKVVFNTAGGKVTFTNGNSQTLNGSYNYPFKKLAINKSANHVTANTTLSVDDTLFFVSGNLVTTSTYLLTMKHGSTASGASNSSFVSGPVKKTGNSAFQFPVGKGTHSRLVEITAPSNSTDAFTAEYFDTSQTSGSTMDTTITFISDCGYWSLNRNTGTSNITPKFAFDSTHCDYLTVRAAHIALWNGSSWKDQGESVTESSNQKTSSAVTSYGHFAMAYKLLHGDAPQMPYALTASATCNEVELPFTTDEIWFSFTPDSVVIKTCLLSPETNKKYAVIKEANFFDAYIPGDELQAVDSTLWPFDSTLVELQTCRAIVTPSNQYLLRISRFTSEDGPGIYDTTDYFVAVCILNSRMIPESRVIEYDSALDLFQILGSVATPSGIVFPGDVLVPAAGVTNIDISMYAPLLIESEVTLCGNYDLLSEGFDAVAIINTQHVPTNPNGTLLTCDNRGDYIFPPDPNAGLQPNGYMFFMMPGSHIRNIRLRGAMPGFQDYNFDDLLCAGIKIYRDGTMPNGPFDISNCEISNFSYAGIYARAGSDNIEVDKCIVHHVKGSGGAHTSSKGYGFWLQGGEETTNTVTNTFIGRTIIDEAKEGVDSQPNPQNITIENCTFGEHFIGENYTRHRFGAVYSHNLGTPAWTPPSTCYYYTESDDATCDLTKVSTTSTFNTAAAAGNSSIKNSIFHQKGKNIISIPYPANPACTTGTCPIIPLFNTDVSNNTFATNYDTPGSLVCNIGGYFRLDDNYAPSCTWDYERVHNTDRVLLSTNPANNKPILKEQPNVFDYQSGIPVLPTSSPQPPELSLKFTNTVGEIQGTKEPIPFINVNDNISVEISPGSNGSQLLTYIVRPQTNNESSTNSPHNTSGNNRYTDSQFTTAVTSGTYTKNFSSTEWETSLPGLYGIDAVAIDGNTSSNYYASAWIHKPIVVSPSTNYWLIFNIKDSWYVDLYGSAIGDVYKQVELNGHPIWREKITEGGDGWEQVAIDLTGEFPVGTEILSYLDINNIKNQLSFSISIPSPASIATEDLRGLNVWVDDIYLKKFDHPQNLILDGDVEATIDRSELGGTAQNDCIWYSANLIEFGSSCVSLSSGVNNGGSKAFITPVERKSGKRALQLSLGGLLSTTSCADFSSFTPALPSSNAMVSACVDFDYRDLVTCSDLTTLGYQNFNTISPYTYNLTSSCTIPATPKVIVDQDIIVGLGATLTIEGSTIAIASNEANPIRIIVNGGTLIIGASAISRITACNDMWQGIENNGGTIVIWTNGVVNEVEDAIAAISSDGGTVKIRYAKFDNNRTALEFQNYINTPSVSSNSDGILGVNFSNSDGILTKDPHRDSPVVAHINLLDNVNIRIGSIGNNAYLNKFSNAYNGIRSSNSTAHILHAEFDQMIESSTSKRFATGCIIAGNNSDVTVGGDLTVSSLFQVNFQNSPYGVISRNSTSIIEGNNFDAVSHGVTIINPISATIFSNDFDNTNFVETSTWQFQNTAITIRSFATPSGVVEVFGNAIIDCRIGIHAIKIPNIEIGGYLSSTALPNTITYNVDDGTNLMSHYTGIWLQNCDNAVVKVNEISNNALIATNPDLIRGIVADNSLSLNICGNTLDKLGIAMQFEGDCQNSELKNNNIIDYYTGINYVNGKSTAQGTSSAPWDNTWTQTVTNTSLYKVDGNLVPSGAFKWFFQGADVSSGNAYSPNLYNTNVVDPEPGATGSSIDCEAETLLVANINRDEVYGPVVADTITYSENQDNYRYLARASLFKLLSENPGLITISSPLDSAFAAFYEEVRLENIGKFDSVRLDINSSQLVAADIRNESIDDDNAIETNIKSINNIQINKIALNIDLDDSDSTVLEAIYEQHWKDGGLSVYDAAAILFKEYYTTGYSLREQSALLKVVKPVVVKKDLGVYPNPAKGKIFFDRILAPTTVIKLYDALGRLIVTGTTSYELDINGVEDGFYVLKVYENKTDVFIKNVVIIN